MSDIQKTGQSRSVANRVLLGVVIFLGVLIFAAFCGLIYGAYTVFGKHNTPSADISSLQQLPPGAKILDMKVDNGRTIVRLKTAKGEEIDIYDTATGKLITRIAPGQ